MSKRIEWSRIIRSVDEAVAYYEEHFAGMSRGQLSNDTENGGSKFYRYVRVKGWKEQVFPPSKNISRKKSLPDKEAAKKYYEEHFAGMTRNEVAKDEEEDGKNFYQYIRKQEWLDILPERTQIDWMTLLPDPESARQYYEEHFSGMGRTEVQKDREKNGLGFHYHVRRQGWAEYVFPEKKPIDWKELLPDEKAARRYYEEHFAGMGRTAVKSDKENGGNAFYEWIRKQGWLDAALPEKKETNWMTLLPDPENAKKYYDENYAGMTRTQVKYDKKNGGMRFYSYVTRQGWSDEVFPAPRSMVSKTAEESKREQLETLLTTYAED